MTKTSDARILVVDDDQTFCQVIAGILNEKGFVSTTAFSAEEALEVLAFEAFSLVLCDIHLPGMSGLDLLEQTGNRADDTAFIMVSGDDAREIVAKSLRLGASAYLIKPFEKTELLDNIEKVLSQRSTAIEHRMYRNRLETMDAMRTTDETVKILCVDDEKNVLKALNRLFMDEDYEIFIAGSGQDGLDIMAAEEGIQLVVSDYRMPEMNGVDFLKKVFEGWPDTIRIVLSGYADTASIVAAINEGQIYKFIPKPWNDDELKLTIAKAIETYQLEMVNRRLSYELEISNDKLKSANEELKVVNENLEKMNQNLEDLVEERTGEILFQNHVLQRSQHILDSLPIGVLGMDTDGMIVQCNQKAQYLLSADGKYPPIGMPAAKVISEDINRVLKSIIQQGSYSCSLTVRGKDVSTRGVIMKTEGKAEGIILILDSRENY